MRRLASLAATCLVGLLGACSGPDLSVEVAEYADHRSSEAHFACNCPEDLFYETYAECIDALGEVDEAEQACMADVLSAEGQDGQEYIDCLNVVWSAHRDCLMANPGCEPGWYDDCAATRTAAQKTCTQVDQQTRIEFSACELD